MDLLATILWFRASFNTCLGEEEAGVTYQHRDRS